MKRIKLHITKRWQLVVLLIVTTGILYSFYPKRENFANDYQFSLYRSWLRKGNFIPYGEADFSRNLITVRFSSSGEAVSEEVYVTFIMSNGKIAEQRERISEKIIDSGSFASLERDYRYFLEQLLIRINSSELSYLTSFLDLLEIDLSLNGQSLSTESMEVELSNIIEQRLKLDSVSFKATEQQGYSYALIISEEDSLEVLFRSPSRMQSLAAELSAKELYAPIPVAESTTESFEDVTEKQIQALSPGKSHYPHRPTYLPPEIKTRDDSLPDRSLTMRSFIERYRNHSWGREVLHNKISDPYQFLIEEFPSHKIEGSGKSYRLVGDSFFNLSSNIDLNIERLRDGIDFNNTTDFVLEDGSQILLPTGDRIKHSNLNRNDLEFVAPFLNQLLAMHRGIGSRLLNFMLVPADVHTLLVLRDPERMVYEFDSYTDLILMLSYYWKDYDLYFNIDHIRQVNNYVELEGSLIAKAPMNEKFDYAEVKFSLDREYRINVAMLILHTGVTMDEEGGYETEN